MPKDAHLLCPMSQALLQAARTGRARPTNDPDGATAAATTAATSGEKSDGSKKTDVSDDTGGRGFTVVRWQLVPRHLEGPEVEYLSTRRVGRLSSSIRHGINDNTSSTAIATASKQPSTMTATSTGPIMKRVTIKRRDLEGNDVIEEVLMAEGQSIDGEILAEVIISSSETQQMTGGIVDSVMVDGMPELGQAPPSRRRPPPPKRKAKGPGRGRRKKVQFASSRDVAASAAAELPLSSSTTAAMTRVVVAESTSMTSVVTTTAIAAVVKGGNITSTRIIEAAENTRDEALLNGARAVKTEEVADDNGLIAQPGQEDTEMGEGSNHLLGEEEEEGEEEEGEEEEGDDDGDEEEEVEGEGEPNEDDDDDDDDDEDEEVDDDEDDEKEEGEISSSPEPIIQRQSGHIVVGGGGAADDVVAPSSHPSSAFAVAISSTNTVTTTAIDTVSTASGTINTGINEQAILSLPAKPSKTMTSSLPLSSMAPSSAYHP